MYNDITALPRKDFAGHILPIGYTADRYFDVRIDESDGFHVCMQEKIADPPIVHTPEEYDFPDRLYEDDRADAEAFGIVRDGELLAAIELCPEKWFNRLRITELWVHESIRRQGVGHALIDLAVNKAKTGGFRALVLETQSCNIHAIRFYRHEGFRLIGFDACAYANNDVARREVRLELGMLFD